jgi:sulfoxide reductase heme-binding subunit YedZ
VILGAFAVDWYAARAAGVVAYLLVSASVALGLALAGKERFDGWPRFAVEDVHRFAACSPGRSSPARLLARVDSQLNLVTGDLVPVHSSYRPLWTGSESSRRSCCSRSRHEPLPQAISLLALAPPPLPQLRVWIAATAHGLGAGTDSARPAFLLMYTVTTAVIGALALRRFDRAVLPAIGIMAPGVRWLLLALGRRCCSRAAAVTAIPGARPRAGPGALPARPLQRPTRPARTPRSIPPTSGRPRERFVTCTRKAALGGLDSIEISTSRRPVDLPARAGAREGCPRRADLAGRRRRRSSTTRSRSAPVALGPERRRRPARTVQAAARQLTALLPFDACTGSEVRRRVPALQEVVPR